MRAEELRRLPLFAQLSDGQLDELVKVGTDVAIEPGIVLFLEGEQADFWWVLIDGAVELVRQVGRQATTVGRMDTPGVWAGGFRAWDEHGVYLATGRGLVAGRMFRVPAESLRDRVAAWSPLAAHLIKGLYGTAHGIEVTARQRESLVTLGTLAAGLAHELNNPAAAAGRAVAALDGACKTLLSALARLAGDDISPAEFSALNELRIEIERPPAARDALWLADREQELSSWLAHHDIDEPWIVASPLAAAGADVEWCERVASALPGTALGPGLEWVASTLSASTLLGEVAQSTHRIAELVAAMRSHSQLDRAALQRVDVTDGLETSIVMLTHKLRGGVTVIREYAADLPQIDAFAGELNQVWTNLIDNAIDAMDGEGALRLVTRSTGDAVIVEVEDDGPGMAPEVAARAFDAFYTTKEVGKGTGLGLDIARRIVVDRHGGAISIDSRPGRTVLRVRLPVRLQAQMRGDGATKGG